MWKPALLLLSVLSLSGLVHSQNITDDRDSRLFSMFQVIKFPNDPCYGTNSKNGTCYTTSECTAKSGTSAGSCASGFGVCCTFTLGCGSSTAQNNSYVENSGAVAGACRYTICKANSNVCQLRLDFISFVITGPSTRATALLNNPGGVVVSDATQCTTDTFTVTSPTGSVPTVCGTLTNDHMYVDASSTCTDLSFVLGSSSTVSQIPSTRSWQIRVSQYNCDYSNLAPSGCLQYFFNTAGTGIVRSFNWQSSMSGYHLANQKQTICVRREAGNCRICWSPVAAMTDFQLSGAVIATGFVGGTACCGLSTKANGYDCVMIPVASTKTNAVVAPPSYCGRRLVTMAATTAKGSICSKQVPFQLSFFSDNYETTTEFTPATSQVMGFQLYYAQSSC